MVIGTKIGRKKNAAFASYQIKIVISYDKSNKSQRARNKVVLCNVCNW